MSGIGHTGSLPAVCAAVCPPGAKAGGLVLHRPGGSYQKVRGGLLGLHNGIVRAPHVSAATDSWIASIDFSAASAPSAMMSRAR
jgi:hypothetical protein